jgi:hypothetical protein
MSDEKDRSSKPSLLQVIGSVLAAGFGVQSQANRERDFAGGSAKTYIVVGLIATVLFILTIIFIVNLVLKTG